MKRRYWALSIVAILLSVGALAFWSWPRSNGNGHDIVALAESGKTPDQMLEVVRQRKDPYLLSANDIIKLKEARVPDTVIIAMLKKKGE